MTIFRNQTGDAIVNCVDYTKCVDGVDCLKCVDYVVYGLCEVCGFGIVWIVWCMDCVVYGLYEGCGFWMMWIV